MRYWVVGGEYTDTSFSKFAPGAREERYGPYPSYSEALSAWSTHARNTIDDACVRYRVVSDEENAA